MPIIEDRYWAARMGLSSDDLSKLRDEAEQKARDAYHATTRVRSRTVRSRRGTGSPTPTTPSINSKSARRRIWATCSAARAPRSNERRQAAGAAYSLHSNYDAMREANWKGDDKYFHCKGNCEASQLGATADWTATHLANGREAYGQYVKHDPRSDELEDQSANRFGRAQGRAQPAGACNALCGRYRPVGLPPDH